MFGRNYFDDTAFVLLQAMQGLSLFLSLLFVAILVILCFGRDRIPRPRVFNLGAILFVTALVIPILCGAMMMVTGMAFSNAYGRSEFSEILGMMMGIIAMLAPLVFAVSLFLLVFGMLAPSSRSSQQVRSHVPFNPNAPAPIQQQSPAPNQSVQQHVAPNPVEQKPAEPHPLD